MINAVSISVIVVPEHMPIHPVNHLLYASDFMNIRNELTSLIPLANTFHAGIKIINLPPEWYMEYINTERLVADLTASTGFKNISITLLRGENISDTLECFSEASTGELLILFTH